MALSTNRSGRSDVAGFPQHDELIYESAGLQKTTNWWGAFVIGLAGTILVTGIAPVMVTELGASSVPVIVVITISGYLVCLLLAELSAMMPHRSGGLPSYAYPAYKDRWPRFAEHVNGFTAWAYWLGWFPVAPLNMILASFYIVDRFHLSTAGFTPIHTPIAWWTLGISIGGLLLLAIPAVMGLRFGTAFATTLALLSMIPLTFLAIAWIFNPSVVDFGQLWHFRRPDGSGFFSSGFGHGWLTLYLAFSFLLTWNVIAMEAAACYIGETKNPDRDAKIAMNLEGLYGMFIYTLIPIAFIIVLGLPALNNAALVDPKTIFVHYAAAVFGAGTGSKILEWLIAVMLILALILSALNAITGTARSLYQMSTDGQFPRFFQRVNQHGVPNRAMWFNVGALDHRGVHGRRRRDLHVLERRIPGLVHPGPDRLLPAAQAPPERPPSVQAARVDEVRGAGHRRGLRDHLLLRRSHVRGLFLQRSRPDDAALLLHRLGGAALLPGLLLVSQARGGQAACDRRRSGRHPAGRDDDRCHQRGSRSLSLTAAAVNGSEPAQRQRFDRILLASEGREISNAAIRRVIELAHDGATVHVFSIARVHGVAFGMQSPGLLPTKREWQQQRDLVAKAVKRLKRRGFTAEGHVLGTRKATKKIVEEARLKDCEAIVMTADADRNRFVGDLLWTQEPQRVRRRAKRLPVFLVVDD